MSFKTPPRSLSSLLLQHACICKFRRVCFLLHSVPPRCPQTSYSNTFVLFPTENSVLYQSCRKHSRQPSDPILGESIDHVNPYPIRIILLLHLYLRDPHEQHVPNSPRIRKFQLNNLHMRDRISHSINSVRFNKLPGQSTKLAVFWQLELLVLV